MANTASRMLAHITSALLVVLLAGCAYPTRNQEAQAIAETHFDAAKVLAALIDAAMP